LAKLGRFRMAFNAISLAAAQKAEFRGKDLSVIAVS
jgi:hypothetical protein